MEYVEEWKEKMNLLGAEAAVSPVSRKIDRSGEK